MNQQILQAIAADLKMSQFEHETGVHFTSRLLYSALACWIKAAALDHPLTDKGDLGSGVSRKHIITKCTRFLEEMLQRNEECRLWFYPEPDCEPPVHLLRTRLIKHMDLLNAGFGTNVILAKESCVRLGTNFECARGCIFHPRYMYSGISTIRTIVTDEASSDSLQQPATSDWFDSFLDGAWWEPYERSEDDWQFFNAYKRVKNNHLCWQSEMPHSVQDLVFARRPIQAGMYEYLLLNIKQKKKHQLDSYLQEIGEHRRIMISLRARAGNKLPILAVQYRDHVHLSMRFHLPDAISCDLETFAWPYNRISDKLEWDMLLVVWEYIKPILTDLGIEIAEEKHG